MASIPLISRRQVLVAAGSVGLLGGTMAARSAIAENPARLPSPDAFRGHEFFSPGEAAFVDAAVDRLIPSDALGPGAAEAGVTVFIDHQLQGPYGRAADWYMQGPWAEGTPQQGYQRRRTPAEVYRAAIAAVDDHSRRASNKVFAALAGEERDALLHALEDGSLDLGSASAKTFFMLLWQDTQEGFFADPLDLGSTAPCTAVATTRKSPTSPPTSATPGATGRRSSMLPSSRNRGGRWRARSGPISRGSCMPSRRRAGSARMA